MNSRVLKFRAYAKAGKMIYFDRPIISDSEMESGNKWGMFFPTDDSILIGGWSDPMQFTGLLDKNGKEIYEGDILLTPMSNGMTSRARKKLFNAVVSWDSVGVMFVLSPKGDIFKGDYRWFPSWNECEVIGNVYEHTELLEVKP